MTKSIIFLAGKPAVGKTAILESLTNEHHGDYTYVHDRLVICDSFTEEGPLSVKNKINSIFCKERHLCGDATFIFVLNIQPKYSYKSLRNDGYRIQKLTLEDYE